MPTFKFFKTFEVDNLSAGAIYPFSWTLEDDYLIKRIYIFRKDGGALNASTLTILIDNVPYTREKVPAALLSKDLRAIPEINLSLKKSQKIDINFYNAEGTAISIFIVLEVYSP